jgi:5-methylcytosine-specific restriction protein A
MNLKELFQAIQLGYQKAVGENFTNHPLAILMRDAPNEIIKPLLDDNDLFIKGSAGMGQWTELPWIGVFNKNETDGARDGVYVVYLFSGDMERLYLCLGQGITDPMEQFGRKGGLAKLKARAELARANYNLPGFATDNKLQLSESQRGSDYERAVIFYKEYDLKNLPEYEILTKDLLELIKLYNDYLLTENVATVETDFSEVVGEVEEGKRLLRQHYVRERNRSIIKAAKEKALKEKGGLNCEVCGFSFLIHYGERGRNFIEGHHKKPVSELQAGEKTSVNDIVLICSNCHSIIHAKWPYLPFEELQKIYRSS